MKPTSKYFLALAFAAICLQMACTKSQQSPSKTTLNTKELSKQLAVGLYNSLSGKYGGANINDGVKAPNSLAPVRGAVRINDVNPFCGLTIDTAFSTPTQSGDTTKTWSGHFKFTYGCTNNVLDSYLVSDTVTYKETSPLFENVFSINQSYYVKALDGTYKTSSVQGYINSSFHTRVINGSGITTQYHNLDSQYGLNNVKVDVSSGIADVVSGTSTFYGQVSNLDATTAVDGYIGGINGTITFQGNHIAKVSITANNETKVYTVNMLTGVVTEG